MTTVARQLPGRSWVSMAGLPQRGPGAGGRSPLKENLNFIFMKRRKDVFHIPYTSMCSYVLFV